MESQMTGDSPQDLLLKYSTGELTVAQRRALIEVVISDQSLYNAFAEEEFLMTAMEDVEFRKVLERATIPSEDPGFRSIPRWSLRRFAVAVALVSVLAVIAVVAVFVRRSMVDDLHSAPMNTAKSAGADQAGALAVLLRPSTRSGSSDNIVYTTAGTRTLRLQLQLPGTACSLCDAELETADARLVGSFRRVVPVLSGDFRVLQLDISGASVAEGDYIIFVRSAGNSTNPPMTFSFRVIKAQ